MEPRADLPRGYLLLADISGYTAFLTQSELDHAQDILHSLFQTLLAHLKPPLVVCELEGDAIFAYAPEGSFLQGQTLLESVERLYCEFVAAREHMQHNTTCTCTACTLIPTLDLKFAVHHGTFTLQQVDRRHPLKPSGPAVILVHRLLKNRVREATGVEAYVFFTEASVQALSLGDFTEVMHPHAEHYEHLGEVHGYVYDLRPVWRRDRERRRVRIGPEDAWMAAEVDLPAPPALVWDYLNEPERKRQWRAADAIKVFGTSRGRMDVGTTHHCIHGKMVIVENIVDWRPCDYLTIQNVWPMQAVAMETDRLSPHEQGTRVSCIVGRPQGRNVLHNALLRVFYAMIKKNMSAEFTQSLARLREMVEADRAAGKIPASPLLAPQAAT